MRLIVISNRLPLTITRGSAGFEYKQTSGGLVTGLKALKKEMEFVWVGNISGISLSEEEKETIKKDCWSQFRSIPVFIPKTLNDDSYNGFCNRTLWPLLHSMVETVVWNSAKYAAYEKYNEMFCERICEMAEEGDTFWVHDYHLMLLPRLIRERCRKNVKIGFFLHTPFPSPEIFSILPPAKEILKGILGSDGVGFHLLDYQSNFIDTCKAILSLKDFTQEKIGKSFPKRKDVEKSPSEGDTCLSRTSSLSCEGRKASPKPRGVFRRGISYFPNVVTIGERRIRLQATSIGIDPQIFRDAVSKPETQKRIRELKEKFREKKIILGVDRTDYIKGMPHRFLGFDRYLQKYGKNAVFLQVAVPSRMEVVEYQALVDKVKLLVSEINGKHGNTEETQCYFLNSSVSFDELCALYAASDVCVVSSLRDGMNLVALEYVACQEAGHGRLLLSKFAGATSTIPGCISVNPWKIDEISEKIRVCLEMGQEEADERYAINKAGVEKFTAFHWARESVAMLKDPV